MRNFVKAFLLIGLIATLTSSILSAGNETKTVEALIEHYHSEGAKGRDDVIYALLRKYKQDKTKREKITQLFLKALWDKEKRVRIAAIRTMEDLEPSKIIISSLAKIIKEEPDSKIRVEAVENISDIKDIEAITPILIFALKDTDKEVRLRAEIHLKVGFRHHSRKEKKVILDQLIKGLNDPALKIIIIKILGHIARNDITYEEDFALNFIYPILTKLLENENDEVVLHAVSSLGFIASKKSVLPLIEALKHKNERILYEALVGLGNIGDARAIDSVKILTNHKSIKVREGAIYALGMLGQKVRVGLVDTLLSSLEDEKAIIRKEAIVALSRVRDPRAIPKLIRALGDSEVVVRRAAAEVLPHFDSPRIHKPLIEALQDSDRGVKIFAIIALVKLKITTASDQLIDLLKDKDSEVRLTAVRALWHIGKIKHNEKAVQSLLKARRDHVRYIRTSATMTLGLTQSKTVVELLIKDLKHPDSIMRGAALIALGKINDDRAIVPLIAVAESKSRLSKEAAKALKNYGEDRITRALISSLGTHKRGTNKGDLIISYLSKNKTDKSLEMLLEAFKNEPDIRWELTFVLGRVTNPKALDSMKAALEDHRASIRNYVKERIAYIEGKK